MFCGSMMFILAQASCCHCGRNTALKKKEGKIKAQMLLNLRWQDVRNLRILTVNFFLIFRIVYKDFMRHFVLNMKPQDSSSLARPKLQPTRMPVSCFQCCWKIFSSKTSSKPSNILLVFLVLILLNNPEKR